MPYKEAPEAIVKRLPVYLRTLDNMLNREEEIVSSRQLSQETGFSPEQIRKDLAFFGAFGTRGSGYEIALLRDKIIRIIGLHRKNNIVLVGAGQLGTALARYTITKNPYVELVGIFDQDPEVIGKEIMERQIKELAELPQVVSRFQVKVAMLTVPAEVAQEVVDYLAWTGVNAILNFAPVSLRVPAGIHLQNVDLTLELQSLIYYVSSEDRDLQRLVAHEEEQELRGEGEPRSKE